jgi:hypothetical protein
MASTYSPNLRIELIGNGEQSNTWGTTTNTNLGTLIEQAISGLVSVDVTAGNVTLTTLNGASDQSRQMIIVATGTPGVTRTITAPAVNKVYIVYNNSNAALSFIASGGTGVSLSVGAKKLIYCDGTNFVEAINSVAITSGSIDGVAIGTTAPAAGKFTTLEYTSTLTGGTGVVNIGSNQIYKDASGNIGIGGASLTGISLLLQKSLTGSTDAAQLYNSPTILSGVTSTASLFVTSPSTQAAAFALASLTHYNTSFNTTGAGSSITNQYGFSAGSSLTTATNNYAFTGNLASGTGRYNLYMAGTADNYIAGSLGIGATTIAGINVLVQKSLTGYADAVQIYNNPTILSDVTSTTSLFTTSPSTQAAAFTLASLTHYNTSFNTKGAGSAITNQYGFSAASGLTGATNNYAFTGNIAAGTGRYNLYMSGTADNYMAGKLGIGTVSTTGESFRVGYTADTTAAVYGIRELTVVNQATTTDVYGVASQTNILAPAALTSLSRFYAAQGSFTGTLTNQFGFNASNGLTGATNNYGFYGNIASGTGRYNLYMSGTADNYLGGSTTISVTDNTNAALRITQLGTGNALVVEDSANPDSTPFMIDASGNVGIGITPSFSSTKLSIAGSGSDAATWSFRYSADGSGYENLFIKSRGTSLFSPAIVQSGDRLGGIRFAGWDGASYTGAALISSEVDGTPGTNDMPGRLVFSTTADGASSPTERMRIDSAGRVGIGGAPAAGYKVLSTGTWTGGTTFFGYASQGTIQSDVTSAVYTYRSAPNTAAASFTLSNLIHYVAEGSAVIGAGSAITTQQGFSAASNLTTATNNYGFYGNIAAGTGRYNLYMAGTAANYLAGDLQLAKTVTAGGTTGAQTINKTTGTINFAAAATSVVVTNSLVTTSSIIIATVGTNDTTMKSVQVVAAAGSFTIYASAAATAETRVNFLITN